MYIYIYTYVQRSAPGGRRSAPRGREARGVHNEVLQRGVTTGVTQRENHNEESGAKMRNVTFIDFNTFKR